MRIQQLQTSIPFLVEDPHNLFYLTGLTLSKGRLLCKNQSATLYVDGRYLASAQEKAPCPVLGWKEFEKIKEKQIGFDAASTSYADVLRLQTQFPSIEWIALESPLRDSRAKKSREEIHLLEKAASLTLKGIDEVVSHFREGISEKELAWVFESYCRQQGAERLSFDPIIAFQENGAYPHHRASDRRLRKGDAVLIDVGAVVEKYAGDYTRFFYFEKPDPKIEALEKLVKEAQQLAMKSARPHMKAGKLDAEVHAFFHQHGVEQFYTHGLGHGIGLETHEFPRLRYDGEDRDAPLEIGMVFTIEPGLYIPKVGGVRLEEMVEMTERGVRPLSGKKR